MTFSEYERTVLPLAVYPGRDTGALLYPALGLAGETGEVVEKIKKAWRDRNNMWTEAQLQELIKEMGDVLWYLAALADEAGTSLDTVAQVNISKLHDRQARGVIHGAGDGR